MARTELADVWRSGRKQLRWMAVFIVLAMVTAACGGDDVGPSSTPAIDLTQESTLGDAPADNDDQAGVAPEPTATPVPTPETETAAEPDPEPTESTETSTPAPEPTETPAAQDPEPTPEPDANTDDGSPVLDDAQVTDVVLTGAPRQGPAPADGFAWDPGQRRDGASGPGGSLASPVPAGTPFLWSHRDAQWELTVEGVVESTTRFGGDDGPPCWLAVVTATVLAGENDAMTSAISLPDIAAVTASDEEVDRGNCDTDEATLAGHFSAGEMQLLTGTTTSYFVKLEFDEVDPANVVALRIGDADDDAVGYVTPSVLAAMPAAPPVADPALSGFEPVENARLIAGSGDEWAMLLHGVFVVDASAPEIESYGEGTECLVVLGSGFPTVINEGAVSDNEPQIRLIAGGVVINSRITSCDTEAIEDAGFPWIASIHQTPGSPASFIEGFVVPARLRSSVSHIVVDDFFTPRVQLFEIGQVRDPATLPAQPEVPADPLLPQTSGPADLRTWTWFNAREELSWQVDVAGVVDLGPTNDGTGRCHAVVGTMAPSAATDRGFVAPDFWLIAEGSAFDPLDRNCDVEALEAAGYATWNEFELDAGEAHAFHATVQVPNDPARAISTLVVGLPTRSAQAIYLDPVFIDAAPPVG